MKRIITVAITAMAFLCAVSCEDNDSGKAAKATLLDQAALDVPALGVGAMTLGVYSDGDWSVLECPDWVSISPDHGTGSMSLTVTIDDNIIGSEINYPRSGNVLIGGATLASRAVMVVNQAGDRYMGVTATDLSRISEADDGETVHAAGVTAIAATSAYTLVTDGSGFAFTDATLEIGRKASVKGIKTSEFGLPCITKGDLLNITEGSYTAPPTEDITETVNEFVSSGQYVKVEGVAGLPEDIISIEVSGAERKVSVVKPLASLGFSSLTNHLIVITGYAFEHDGGIVMVVDDVEDKGITRNVDLVARWLFDTDTRDINGPTFTGAQISSSIYKSTNDKSAGDGGRYIVSTEGDARITYENVDKTEIDVDGTFSRLIGKTGEPYVTGAWAGDCWQFSVNLSKTYKAGSTVHFAAVPRASAGSIKYWVLEILDGGEWIPMTETSTVEIEGKSIVYNFEQKGTAYLQVDVDYTLTADAEGTLLIRYRAMSTATAGSGALKTKPDGATHRLAGNTYTNPYIEIAYDR